VSKSQNPEYPGKELESMSFAVNGHKWIVNELGPFLGYTAVEVGARSVTLYDRVVVPPMRLFEKLLVPPIGKNVLLVARKT
jgi:hypothetical protein